MRSHALSAVSGLVLLLLAPQAEAKIGLRVGLGLDFGAPLGERGQEVSTGLGATLNVGYVLRFGQLELVPELSLRFIEFGADPPGEGDADHNTFQVMGGARVGWGEWIVPQVFVHLGYGQVEGMGSDYSLFHSGFTLEAGAGVDLALLSWMRVGASGSYCSVFPQNAGHDTPYQWIAVGAHVVALF